MLVTWSEKFDEKQDLLDVFRSFHMQIYQWWEITNNIPETNNFQPESKQQKQKQKQKRIECDNSGKM